MHFSRTSKAKLCMINDGTLGGGEELWSLDGCCHGYGKTAANVNKVIKKPHGILAFISCSIENHGGNGTTI